MSEFTAEWLALREPADWQARSARVTEAVTRALPRDRTIHALDLAAGAGSNMRFLARTLALPQDWLLVDRNPALLSRATDDAPFAIESRVVDLSRLDSVGGLFASRDLVTASALLDLVSEPWLHALCLACGAQRAAVLFALSYDGRIDCSPRDSEDERIRSLVNRHQRTDKGFGVALGPDAAGRAARYLTDGGYQVVRDRSDWILEPQSAALQRELIDGWATAATEVAPADAQLINAWRQRRLGAVDQQRSRLVVGHEDLGAFIS